MEIDFPGESSAQAKKGMPKKLFCEIVLWDRGKQIPRKKILYTVVLILAEKNI